MASTQQARSTITDAYEGTQDIIGRMRCILDLLKSTGLDLTPMAEHLHRAQTELLRAKMQAEAFLHIA